MTRSTHVCIALLAGLAACGHEQTADETSPVQTGRVVFAAPEGVAVHERWVIVTNSAFDGAAPAQRWNEGFVTLIDRQTRQVVATIPTTQRNPVDVAVVGNEAYVINAGTLELGSDGVAQVTSDGGLDIIDLQQPGGPTTVSWNIPLPRQNIDTRIGAYGSIAISPDGRWAYIGSGTRGDVFQLDLSRREVLRGAENPIVLVPTPDGENGMTVVRRLGDTLAVLDFNRDMLCLSSDWSSGLEHRRCEPIGVSSELLEGPIDLAGDQQGNALVLMSIANSLYRVDVAATPLGIEHDFVSTGLSANRIAVRGDWGYVVNSSSNNLQRVNLQNGAWNLPFSVFPSGANPFSLALSDEPEGLVAWVTLFGSNQLALVALDTGNVIARLGPRAVVTQQAGRGQVPPACDPTPALVGAVNIVSLEYGAGAGYGQDDLPQAIQGGPTGAGEQSGSVQGVLSLGQGGTIVLDFGDYDIVDGPGPDLIVFENAFVTAPKKPFAEPAVVGLAIDSSTPESFLEFPCALETPDDEWPYPGCAGVRPVLANSDENCIDPSNTETAGGDAFDLADLGIDRARFLRIRDAGISLSGETTRGFDLDAVVLIHAERR